MREFIIEQTNLFLSFINEVPNSLIYLVSAIIILTLITYFLYQTTIPIISIISTHLLFAFLFDHFYESYFSITVTLISITFPTLILSTSLSLLINPSSKRQKTDSKFDVKYETHSGSFHFNLIRGMAIFGSSGSGKTKSGFLPIIKHCADNQLSGIIYDYKDFELTELVNYFFKDSKIPIKTIYPTDPDYSHKVNPIDPSYISQMADMDSTVSVFMENLVAGDNGAENFFAQAASAGLSGVCWRLLEDYTDKCHLPMAAGIILMQSTDNIRKFIEQSTYAKILAAPYLDSMDSDKQFAAVQATLTTALKKIMSPQITTILSGSDFSLKLNDKDHPTMMTLVNNPLYENVHSAIIATIMQTSIRLMSKRKQNESILLIDEGATMKLPNFQRSPATLRTFNIATVWGLQDKVQASIMYNENVMKAILSNLSTKMFGKVNDPDTAKFYEHYFDLIQKEQISYSRSDNFIPSGDSRINVSKREEAKHRGQEFYKLDQGEFFMFDQFGESHKLQFKEPHFEEIPSTPIYNYSKTELRKNFDDLLTDCKNIS